MISVRCRVVSINAPGRKAGLDPRLLQGAHVGEVVPGEHGGQLGGPAAPDLDLAVGHAVAREWLAEMLAVPKPEFPEFPAALSHIMMVTPQEALPPLERRETALAAIHQGLEAGMAAAKDLPRVVMLESEYVLATAALFAEISTSGEKSS